MTPTPPASATRTYTTTSTGTPTATPTTSPTVTQTVTVTMTATSTPTATPSPTFRVNRNWFNPQKEPVTITFQLTDSDTGRIEVFNSAGEYVGCIWSGYVVAYQPYQIEWWGRSAAGDALASGVYVLVFRSGAVGSNARVALIH